MGTKTNMPNKTEDEVRIARADLLDGLQTILRRDGESELVRVLVDLFEAGQLELVYLQEGCQRIRFWQVAKDTDLVARCYAIRNDVEAAFVRLLIKGSVVFSVEARTLPAVVWRVVDTSVN